MDSFLHNRRFGLITVLVSMVAAAAVAVVGAQELPDLDSIKSLPIDLDAASSEFDRKQNKLLFRKLEIKQGPLSIRADQGVVTRLDFENSRWEFSGNVMVKNGVTTALCDYAEIQFFEHQIRNAIMQGQPVRLEQVRLDDGRQTEGKADKMAYDVETGIITMSENAWISDGANEVSGDQISYDLVRETITAAANGDGQIRMTIIPPEDSLNKLKENEIP